MLYPAIAPMVEQIGSRYSLVIATAKRARQIALAAEKDEIAIREKPVKMAIIEISKNHINVKSKPVEVSAVVEEAIRTRVMEIEHGNISYDKDDYGDYEDEDGEEANIDEEY